MDIERFTEGIRYIEVAGGIKLEQERKRVYYDRLQAIPNNLWEAGVIEVVDTHQYATFPTIAEIGEVCVPGKAEQEELDKWTRRWTKIYTPWNRRLNAYMAYLPSPTRAQLPAPEVQSGKTISAPRQAFDCTSLITQLRKKLEKRNADAITETK